MNKPYDVIIIGAGPAGLVAGLYASRARLQTLILEKEMIGGELMNRDLIENYPGYPGGVLGPELGSKMAEAVRNYGTKIAREEVTKIAVQGTFKRIYTSQGVHLAKTVIIGGGAYPRKLEVPGEEELATKGVFYCATCDGPRFADKTVAVAGGGDSGITEALFLSRMASKVIVLEVLPHCTASRILQERALANPKIEIRCGARILAIRGNEHVSAVEILDEKTGQRGTLEVEGVLVHVGIKANTAYLRNTVPLDERGQILVNDKMETQVIGVFAAGDIRHNSPWQISTAVGDGATAAISLVHYLERH